MQPTAHKSSHHAQITLLHEKSHLRTWTSPQIGQHIMLKEVFLAAKENVPTMTRSLLTFRHK